MEADGCVPREILDDRRELVNFVILGFSVYFVCVCVMAALRTVNSEVDGCEIAVGAS